MNDKLLKKIKKNMKKIKKSIECHKEFNYEFFGGKKPKVSAKDIAKDFYKDQHTWYKFTPIVYHNWSIFLYQNNIFID